MEPFKNNISPELVGLIADQLGRNIKNFDRQAFEVPILAALPKLELKARSQLIADHLHLVLPAELKTRNRVLLGMLHPDSTSIGGAQSDENGIRGWGMFPLGQVVGQHGLMEFDGSMGLLKEMTSRFSSEFDVRPFLVSDQERALKIMGGWLNDPDHHVRRLVSESTRPRLPWGIQLKSFVKDPSPVLPLLFALRDDPSEYVRRSVANHLNDIAKDHPDLVADIAGEWLKGASKDRIRLIRHACRTLIKAGHEKTLRVLGYDQPKLHSVLLSLDCSEVQLGDSLEFTLALKSKGSAPQPLLIDYVIHHKKANGTTSPKVFKWKDTVLKPKDRLETRKLHKFKPITTRVYYPGQHFIEILINGVAVCKEPFHLTLPQSVP